MQDTRTPTHQHTHTHTQTHTHCATRNECSCLCLCFIIGTVEVRGARPRAGLPALPVRVQVRPQLPHSPLQGSQSAQHTQPQRHMGTAMGGPPHRLIADVGILLLGKVLRPVRLTAAAATRVCVGQSTRSVNMAATPTFRTLLHAYAAPPAAYPPAAPSLSAPPPTCPPQTCAATPVPEYTRASAVK
jgi:hypothetical protein